MNKPKSVIEEWQEMQKTLPKQSRGVGDTIAKITSKVGIKPCGGCKKRQEKLNEMFPYKK